MLCQDVRHVELDIGGSGLTYSPGDLLAVLPRQPPEAVKALLQRCGWEPCTVVRVERLADDDSRHAAPITAKVRTLMQPLEPEAAEDGESLLCESQPGRLQAVPPIDFQLQAADQLSIQQSTTLCGHHATAAAAVCPESACVRGRGANFALIDPPIAGAQVQLGALVAGALDIAGASPRRFFFEVLRHLATDEHERERLEYLSTPEGRDDLYRYNQREGAVA